MDVSRYKGLFLSEAAEYLRALDQGLVALERDPRNPPMLDEVFRSAHSLKGMAGAMGYEEILRIAHAMEDLLVPMRRQGELRLGSSDTLLSAVDALRGIVAAIEEDRPIEVDVGSVLLSIRDAGGLHHEDLPEPLEPFEAEAEGEEPPAPAPDPTPPERTFLPPPVVTSPAEPSAGEDWRRHWRLWAEVAGTCASPAVRAFIVHRKVAALGEVVDMQPSLAAIKAGEFRGSLEIRLRTVLAREEIVQALASIPDLSGYRVEASGEPAAESGAEPVMPAAARTIPVSPRAPAPLHRGAQVRVRTELLDQFMDSVSDLLLAKSRLEEVVQRNGAWELRDAFESVERSIRQVHERVLAVRLTPVSALFERLPRVVRDLAVRKGRRVHLELAGADVEIDRAVVETVDTPLLHLLRNAVDHGIESPEERSTAGKGPDGVVRVTARRERGEVVIEVADDGRGLDPVGLREAVIARGLLPRDVVLALDDRGALQLICLPGFSTAREVTETSGRGVGMDAVKTAVESLGGNLEIASELGIGTRIALRLPATVAVVNVLTVLSAGQVYCLPVARVERSVLAGRDALRTDGGRTWYVGADAVRIPVYALETVLGLAEEKPLEAPLPIVIVAGEHGPVALAVDGFLGLREVVLRSLGRLLGRIDGLSGVTLFGDGRPSFVLDPARLCRALPVGGGNQA